MPVSNYPARCWCSTYLKHACHTVLLRPCHPLRHVACVPEPIQYWPILLKASPNLVQGGKWPNL